MTGQLAVVRFGWIPLLVVLNLASVYSQQSNPASRPPGLETLPVRLESNHVPNPVMLHPKVISGGLPEDEGAFRELLQWGVRTIISVDGAKPDVQIARKYGLRYVHLPHGYDGIPKDRALELAKAVRELPGPIYIHCHHGKHRSPVAATVACVAAGLVPPAKAISILELAGTNENYRGLFRSAREAEPIEPAELDQLRVQFRETVEVPPMAEAMVQLDQTYENLNQIAASDWRTPAKHPDLTPAHQALLLREHFAELIRTPDAQSRPKQFLDLLRESEDASKSLEQLLHQRKPMSKTEAAPARAIVYLKQISDNCKSCHIRYRDVPLSER